MSRVPGRATSLASVGLLLGLSVLLAALGYQAGANRPTSVVSRRSQTSSVHPGPSPTATTNGPIDTQSFTCPPRTGPGEQDGRPLAWVQPGLVVTATTFCAGSAWYVSERIAGRATLVAEPFKVPDDPPIPASVTAKRFVPLRKGVLPAVLVERERFGNASLYELFTLVSRSVEPMSLNPGGSPVLLLRATSQLQGAGFWCSAESSGAVIRQYEWYVVDPTTLRTNANGEVLGDPAVFFQTTVYTVDSADSFTAATLTTITRGYTSAEALSDSSC